MGVDDVDAAFMNDFTNCGDIAQAPANIALMNRGLNYHGIDRRRKGIGHDRDLMFLFLMMAG